MAEGGDTPTFVDGSFDDNLQEQRDEVLALQSIYDGGDIERLKLLSSPTDHKEGLYTLHITVPVHTEGRDFKVDILMPAKNEEASATPVTPPSVGKGVNFMRSDSGQRWVGSFTVKYLSPLNLQVVLPPTYPSQGAPVFTLSCVWLTANQLSALCKQLDKLWNDTENLPVIFTWIDWLENNTFSHLGVENSVLLMPVQEDDDKQDDRALFDYTDMGQAVCNMLQYNRFHSDLDFCRTYHDCQVCYEELPGNQFFRLNDCEHHFCQDCLTSYCEHHVSIGTVENLLCPDTECESTIPPHIVQSVLPADMFDRWERLMLQKTLESMTDICWCPRCNNPVIQEAEEDLKLAHCTSCFFSFCTQCRDPWHQGEMCMSMEDKLRQVEKRAPAKNEEERQRFEALKKKVEEEIRSLKELAQKNRKCPRCRATIEKTGGCNSMTCRCGQNFCWLCSKPITGYSHFTAEGCSVSAAAQRIVASTVKETPDAVLWIQATLDTDPNAAKRVVNCPTCGQRNLKEQRNNHIKCWGCKSNFCFMCRKKITGLVSSHYTAGPCTQHS